MARTAARPFEDCRRDLEHIADDRQLFAQPEPETDPRRGEVRFAAEVAIAEMRRETVPIFAHERARETLFVLAKG